MKKIEIFFLKLLIPTFEKVKYKGDVKARYDTQNLIDIMKRRLVELEA